MIDCRDCKEDKLKCKILGVGKSDFEIQIKEALYIKSLSPSLNSQISNKGSTYFKLNVFNL